MTGIPRRLAASAAALRRDRPAQSLARLEDSPCDGPWRAAELGLRALAAKGMGAPVSERQALLDECGQVFDAQLAQARDLLDARTSADLATARDLCDRLIAAMTLLGDAAVEGQALARNVRATILFHEGRPQEALQEAGLTLALRPASPEGAHVWADLSVNAASIACELGDYVTAETFIAVGLERIHALSDHPDRIGDVLRIAADIDLKRGRFLEARQKIVTTVSVFDALGIDRSRKLAQARATLATLEREFGRDDLAAEFGRSALEAWPHGDEAEYAVEATSLWTHWALTKDWAWLRPRLKRLARIATKGFLSWADFLIKLGVVYMDRSRFHTADRLYGRLVAWLDAVAPAAFIPRIDARRQHALTLIERGQFDRAAARLSEAGVIVEAAGAGAHIYRHVLARDQGVLAERRGEPQDAIAWYLRAVTEEAQNVDERFGATISLSEAFGHRDALDAVSALLRLVSAEQRPDEVRRAHEAVLASRGRAMRALETHRFPLSDDASAIATTRSELSRLVEWGGRLQAAGHRPPDFADLALALAALDGQLTLAAPRSPDDRLRAPAEDDLPAADEAALDFVVAIEGARTARDVRLHAFITHAQARHPVLVTWRDMARLLRQLEELRHAMSVAPERAEPDSELTTRLDDLSRALWWPIAPHLHPAVRRLRLRTDGNLAHLPFPALRDRAGICLCEQFEIVLIGPNLPASAPDEPPQDFLVVGDPTPACSWQDRISLMTAHHRPTVLPTERLRNSRHEARTVVRLLEDHGRSDGMLLVGARATRQDIIDALPARFVHLAMHGFALPRGVTGGSPREDAVVGHPAPDWRAGLVCAGARAWLSRTGPLQGDDDGLLLARDIASMNLSGVELVVLAACDTSFGEPVPGEGVLALADAFLAAGARTVVASAWSLDDVETTHFMREFYSALLNGKMPSAALRIVQSAWSQARRHPRFWAGFSAHVRGKDCGRHSP